MDSEARDATQSSASVTRSKSSLSKNTKRVFTGFFFSLLLHCFCFYGIYIISQKVFEVLARREKVFRFTLIGGIRGEKKTAKASFKSSVNSTLNSKGAALENREKSTHSKDAESSNFVLPAPEPGASRAGSIDLYVSYPHMSRLLGEEGEVLFVKDSNGTENPYRKLKSSGHRRLDEAAEKVLNSEVKKLSSKILSREVEHLRFIFKLNDAQSM